MDEKPAPAVMTKYAVHFVDTSVIVAEGTGLDAASEGIRIWRESALVLFAPADRVQCVRVLEDEGHNSNGLASRPG